MVFGELQSLGLGVVLLFLLPGLAGVKAYLWQVQRSDQFGRLDTIGLSFFVSLTAIAFLYLGYWTHLGWPPGTTLFGDAPLWTDLKSHIDSVPEYLGHYGLLMLLTVTGGYLFGRMGVGIGGDPDHRSEIWEYHFKHITNGEADNDVRIVTADGESIEGKVDKFGESANTRDLVLEDPRRLATGDDVERRVVESWDGQLYVHDQNISKVYFDEPSSLDKEPSSSDDAEERAEADEEIDDLEKLASEAQQQQTEDEERDELS